MNLPALIHKVARGRKGSENLTREEARAALAALLGDDADPVQLGAFLIAMRMKGETAEELAGFVEAVRAHMPEAPAAPKRAVDLPCYAGKARRAHLHLVAALRAAKEGIAVCVHGAHPIPGRVSAYEAAQALGIPVARDVHHAAALLHDRGIAFLPLEAFAPALAEMLALRARIGVRSFAHTVARLVNPLRLAGQLGAYFHLPYAARMAKANALLAQPRALIFQGREGEPEPAPARSAPVVLQAQDALLRLRSPQMGLVAYPRMPKPREALLDELRRWREGRLQPEEEQAVAQMLAMFRWAAGGVRPQNWEVEPWDPCASSS